MIWLLTSTKMSSAFEFVLFVFGANLISFVYDCDVFNTIEGGSWCMWEPWITRTDYYCKIIQINGGRKKKKSQSLKIATEKATNKKASAK